MVISLFSPLFMIVVLVNGNNLPIVPLFYCFQHSDSIQVISITIDCSEYLLLSLKYYYEYFPYLVNMNLTCRGPYMNNEVKNYRKHISIVFNVLCTFYCFQASLKTVRFAEIQTRTCLTG